MSAQRTQPLLQLRLLGMKRLHTHFACALEKFERLPACFAKGLVFGVLSLGCLTVGAVPDQVTGLAAQPNINGAQPLLDAGPLSAWRSLLPCLDNDHRERDADKGGHGRNDSSLVHGQIVHPLTSPRGVSAICNVRFFVVARAAAKSALVWSFRRVKTLATRQPFSHPGVVTRKAGAEGDAAQGHHEGGRFGARPFKPHSRPAAFSRSSSAIACSSRAAACVALTKTHCNLA